VLSQVLRSQFLKTQSDAAAAVEGGGPEDLGPWIYPAVTQGDVLDVKVFVLTTPVVTPQVAGRFPIQRKPLWQYSTYIAGSEKDVSEELVYRLPKDFYARNSSLYCACVLEYAVGRNEEDGTPKMNHVTFSYPLIEFKRKKNDKRQSLLQSSGNEEDEEGKEGEARAIERKKKGSGEGEGEGGEREEYVPYWVSNVTLSLVPYEGVHQLGKSVQPPLDRFLRVDTDTGKYAPFLYMHNFWNLEENEVEVTEATTELALNIRFHELRLWLANLYLQMERNWEMQASMGLSNRQQTDDMKRMLLENNPVFLGITTFVSLLHTIFDMLAFKSDIGFWSKNESMKGLSARTIVINCSCQIIIFLYLLDNDTSYLILFSSGLGLLIEMWKVTKACKVEFALLKGIIPFVRVKDRDSYIASSTKAYDKEASRYLSYALFPLVLGYSVYSLVYETHKNWYAWVLSSLVGAVYTFGFILMCPQLYINYRMKSVAHLPWRQMTYKFLNTIIDDLFAFVIKMPALHRLSVFRDDVIFCIYMYQRWIYRVDKTRVNEFGYSEKEQKEKEEEEEEERAKRLEETKKEK
jgi:hypothetical protein